MSAWDHRELTCCTCGAPIMLHAQHEATLRASHETFYCPAGHGQHFAGKTQQEKELDRLTAKVESLRDEAHHWQERWQEVTETRRALTAAVQVCPLGCGHAGVRRLPWCPDDEDLHRFLDRVGRDLTRHLAEAHNATIKTQRLLTAGGS